MHPHFLLAESFARRSQLDDLLRFDLGRRGVTRGRLLTRFHPSFSLARRVCSNPLHGFYLRAKATRKQRVFRLATHVLL